jgi:hypothetical protein
VSEPREPLDYAAPPTPEPSLRGCALMAMVLYFMALAFFAGIFAMAIFWLLRGQF